MTIEKAIGVVLDTGFIVAFRSLKLESGHRSFTFTLTCPHGKGFGRGVRFSDPEAGFPSILTNASEVIGDSIVKTLSTVKEKCVDPNHDADEPEDNAEKRKIFAVVKVA
jgi:hypothetical protein